jgi:hypothetical protein
MTKQQYDSNGHPIPVFFPTTTQNKAYTVASAAIANAVGGEIRLVRVWCTTDCHIKVGITPTATTADIPITAKVAEYIPVNGGDKLAAIRISADGVMYVTELL